MSVHQQIGRSKRRLFVERLERRDLLAANPYGTNPLQPLDVNRDGNVSALDALRVINAMGRSENGVADPSTSIGNFIDVSGDGQGTALDALRVINAMGREAPLIAATLPNDSAPGENSNFDLLTSDYGIALTVSVRELGSESVFVRIDGVSEDPFSEITDQFIANRALFTAERIHEVAGKFLEDGDHQFEFRIGESGSSITFTLTIDRQGPLLDGALVNDSGVDPFDGVTNDSTLTGSATDAFGLEPVMLDVNGTSEQIVLDEFGAFAILQDLAEGSYVIELSATDLAGNVTHALMATSITVDRTAPETPTFDLSLGSDSGIVGDQVTAARIVTLNGRTSASARLELVGTNRSSLASSNGVFQITQVSLADGDNPVTVRAVDLAGNAAVNSRSFRRNGVVVEQDPVLFWNAAALDSIRRDASTAPLASRMLAIMHAAVFDVVANLEGTPSQFIALSPPADASLTAAIAAAAHEVLSYAYPAQQASLDQRLTDAISGVVDGSSRNQGLAFGRDLAEALIRIRDNDGWREFTEYLPANAPGQWRPTEPSFDEAMLPQWADVTPFVLASSNQFRPGGPPSLASVTYANDYDEVRRLGQGDSSERTGEQTEIARFWADGPGTYTPPGHWNQIAEQVALSTGNSLTENARLFATLNLALGDAAIAAWDAKFANEFWRPITAIQAAAVDGNDLTTSDSTWEPLLISPPFPEYVSGHSTFSGAAAQVLQSTFGDGVAFVDQSLGLPGVDRSFAGFTQAAAEAGRSRIYGGIHFEFSNQDGLQAGRELAEYVLQSFATESDSQPPRILLDGSDLAVFDGAVQVNGRVLDNLIGVAGLTVSIDGGPTTPLAFDSVGRFSVAPSLATDGTSDGLHTLALVAIDAAGNQSDPLPYQFILDTQAPEIRIDSPTQGAELTPRSRLTGSVSSTGSSIIRLAYQFSGQNSVPIPFDSSTGAFDVRMDLSRLPAGSNTVIVMATDVAGNTALESRSVNLAQRIPFVVDRHLPLNGALDVGSTFRPQVFFSRPVDASTLTSSNFFATGPSGAKLDARIVPADDGSFAWLFFTDPMPGRSRITVHLDGSTILSAGDRIALDANLDGSGGGSFEYSFATVSLTPVVGTSISGRVVDPGPDLRPMTLDDIAAGTDQRLRTADDLFLWPIAGVRVYVVGLEDEAVMTDANGSFVLDSVPTGNVKLAIDGLTASSPPVGVYFPEMVMDLNLEPGRTNTVLGSMGSLQVRLANRDRQEIYLPRVSSSILQTAGGAAATMIGVEAVAAPNLTAQQRANLTIEVQAGSLRDQQGNPIASGQVGISTVPPELVREMLPPGLLQHAFDITVQAPGITNFSSPAPMTFPNTFGAAPGSQLNFLSFDHTTGRLVIEGSATVSADGSSAHTNPGTGITHPGWHALTPQGSDAGPYETPDPLVCELPGEAAIAGSLSEGTAEPQQAGPFPVFELRRAGRRTGPYSDLTDFLFTADQGEGLLEFFNPQPTDPCFPRDGELLVDVVVKNGQASQFLRGLESASFILAPGDRHRISFHPKVFSGPELRKFQGDRLYGIEVKVVVRLRGRDGSYREVDDAPDPFHVYRYVEAADDVDDRRIRFNDTIAEGSIERSRQATYIGDASTRPVIQVDSPSGEFSVRPVISLPGTEGGFDFAFDPSQAANDRSAKLLLTTPVGTAASGPGDLFLLGNGVAKTTIYMNHADFETALASLVTRSAVESGDPLVAGLLSQNHRDALATPALREAFFNAVLSTIQERLGNLGLAVILSPSRSTAASDFRFEWSGGALSDTADALAQMGVPAFRGIQEFHRSLSSSRRFFNEARRGFVLAQILSESRQKDPHLGKGFLKLFFTPNPGLPFDASLQQLIDLFGNAFAHEIGHGLGLPHVARILAVTGDNEVQQVTVSASAATFTMTLGGVSETFNRNAPASLLQTRLRQLQGMVGSNLVVTGNDGGPYTINFVNPVTGSGKFGAVDFPQIQTSGATTRTVTDASITPSYRELVLGSDRGSNDLMIAQSDFVPRYFQPLITQPILKMSLGTDWSPADATLARTVYTRTYRKGDFEIVKPPTLGDVPSAEDREELLFTGSALAVLDSDGILTDDTIEFGTIVADGPGGDATTRTLQLINYGSETVLVSSIRVVGGSDRFSVPDIAAFVLEPGEGLDIDVTFDPSVDGPATGILSIDSNAEIMEGRLELLGEATPFNSPRIAAAASLLLNNNFGGADIGQSLSYFDVKGQFATIENRGVVPLNVNQVRISADVGSSDYSVTSFSGPVSVQPGASLDFNVLFKPIKSGFRRGVIEVQSDDPEHPVLRIPIVGTGLTERSVDIGDDYIAIGVLPSVFDTFPANELRTRSDSGDNWSLFLPPDRPFEAITFDPISGLVQHVFGRSNLSGQTTSLVAASFTASIDRDTDGDGLPDDVEFAIGTSPTSVDTDGDGLSDLSAIEQSLNPLTDRAGITGIIAAIDLSGPAQDLVLTKSPADPNQILALVATGSGGLDVVDVTRFDRPILISQIDLPSFASKVAFDSLRGRAFVATGDGGLYRIDLTDLNRPVASLLAGGEHRQVTSFDGRVYTSTADSIRAHDPVTGELTDTLSPGNGSIVEWFRDAASLYLLFNNAGQGRLQVIDLSGPSMVARGSLTLPRLAANLFVSDGVAWIGANEPPFESTGLMTVNVAAPNSLQLISDIDNGGLSPDAIALTASGVAVLANHRVGAGGVGLPAVSVVDATAAFRTDAIFTQYPLPDDGRAVALYAGLAYVADDAGGLQVLNYLPFDRGSVAPTVGLNLVADVDPIRPGNQLFEGQTVVVTASLRDDVQVRDVQLLLNGAVVRDEVSYPFDLTIGLPTIAQAGGNQALLQVRATDTGGNTSLSLPVLVELVPDTIAPTIVSLQPADGSLQPRSFRRVTLTYSEAPDPATLSPSTHLLRGPGGVVAPDAFRVRQQGTTVEIVYPPLAIGDYEFVIAAADVTDRVGNAIGAADVVTQFRVDDPMREPTIVWINPESGLWDDPNNWEPGVVPGENDDVRIDVPGDITVTFSGGLHRINSLFSNNRLVISGGRLDVTETVQVNNEFVLTGLETSSPDNLTTLSATVLRGSGGEGITVGGAFGWARLVDSTVETDIHLNDSFNALMIEGGLSLGGELHLSGTQSKLVINGTQEIQRGTIVFTDNPSTISTVHGFGDSTLTLGSEVVVRGGRGIFKDIGPQRGLSLINHGTMIVSGTFQTIVTETKSFTNHGTLQAMDRARLSINDTTWSNSASGQIKVENATLDLGASLTATWTNAGLVQATNTSSVNFSVFDDAEDVTWSNTGLFRFDNSDVITNGQFTSDDLQNLQRVGGSFSLGGIMDNRGRTFQFDDAKGVWSLNPGPFLPGRILGGTLVLNPPVATLLIGGPFNGAGEGGGVLDGVRIEGDLLLGPLAGAAAQTVSSVRVVNGLQVTGTIIVRCGFIGFDGTQALSDLRFQMKGQGPGRCSGGSISGGATSDVTFADNVDIMVEGPGNFQVLNLAHEGTTTVKGTTVDTFRFGSVNRGAITVEPGANVELSGRNEGTINVNQAGALAIRFAWENLGTFDVVDTFTAYGPFDAGGIPASAFGTFRPVGGRVNLRGEIDNTGQTLFVNTPTTPWWLDSDGVIRGGEIQVAADSQFVLASGTLHDTVVRGDASATSFVVAGTVTFDGTVRPLGNNAVGLLLGGLLTAIPVDIPAGRFEFPGPARSAILEPIRLQSGVTFGPGVEMVGGFLLADFRSDLLHQGRIEANLPSQPGLDATIHFSRSSITNEGTLAATNGGTLRIATLATNRGELHAGVGGQIQLDDDLPQDPNGLVSIDVSGTATDQFGRIIIADEARLAGNLQLDFVNGFAPQSGDSFSILSYASFVGKFAGVNVSGLQGGLVATPIYDANELRIVIGVGLQGGATAASPSKSHSMNTAASGVTTDSSLPHLHATLSLMSQRHQPATWAQEFDAMFGTPDDSLRNEDDERNMEWLDSDIEQMPLEASLVDMVLSRSTTVTQRRMARA